MAILRIKNKICIRLALVVPYLKDGFSLAICVMQT